MGGSIVKGWIFLKGAFSDWFKVIVFIFILPLRLLSTDLFEHIFILIPPQFSTGKSFQVAKVSSQSDGITKWKRANGLRFGLFH